MIGKKVAFVMPFHVLQRFGGAEVQAWLLAKELAHRGYEIHYICQSVTPEKVHRKEIIDDVTIHWLPMWGYLSGRFRWLDAGKYFRALTETNPDFVIQRMTSFVTGIAGLYCKIHGSKFIWICTDDEAPVKWCFLKKQIQKNRSSNISPIKAAVFLFNAFITDVSRNWGMKQITHPFTQNENQRLTLEKEYSLDSHRMISGHEAPKMFCAPEERLENGIVLWVANLGSRKQPEKFLELARLGKETTFRFVMIGGREDESYLDTLFHNKPDNLEWLGRLSFKEALEWFNRAAFFVNTSTKKGEGFPNTFIQAWLRGVPTFSIGVDPNGVISENRLGYVATDLCDIERKLIQLVNSPEEYIELSRNAKTYAERHHTVEVMTDHFLHVLQQEYALAETMQS